MTLVKWMLIGLLLLAVAEIGLFIAVAGEIGSGIALLLVLATSLAGALVLKRAGRAQIEKVRGAVAQRTPIAVESADLMLVVSGILLLLPGFVTDLAALALLVPALRRRIVTTFSRLIKRQRARRPGAVLELERDEWQRVPDDKIESR